VAVRLSVIELPECPHRSAISSLMPLSDNSETKLCRSSRGIQSAGLRPAALMIGRKAAGEFGLYHTGTGPSPQDVVPVELGACSAGEDEAPAPSTGFR
jgi:hypothetical protein